MSSNTRQEAFLPDYDYIPEDWNQARQMLTEYLRKVSDTTNVRTIGWHLEEELQSGGQFIKGSNGEFRAIYRKLIDCSPLVLGPQSFSHGINFTGSFTLVNLWVAATHTSLPLKAVVITDANVDMDSTMINITSPQAFEKAYAIVEYVLQT